jgi:hypothetical protein
MFSFIPEIFIASVRGSPRIPIVRAEMMRLGIDKYTIHEQEPPVITDPKKRTEAVTLSCTENHLSIYQKGMKHPYILVLEDDVYIPFDRIDIFFILDEVRKFIQSNDWDIFYLGHFPWMIKKISPDIGESISWCTHAYFISQRAMKYISRYKPREILQIGRLIVPGVFPFLFPEGGGIDTFMAYCAHKKYLKSHCSIPMLVYQYSIPRWKLKADIAQRLALFGGGGSFITTQLLKIIGMIVIAALFVWKIRKSSSKIKSKPLK